MLKAVTIVALSALLAGCGGADRKADEPERPQRASHRQMAVLVRAPPGTVPDDLGLRLAEHLAGLYVNSTTGAVRHGAFKEPAAYDDALLTDLALLGVDDLFVFDLYPGAEAPAGRLLLVKADTGSVLASRALSSEPVNHQQELEAFCLAEHRFADKRPKSNRFALGTELYRRRRWREARSVLQDELNHDGLDTLQHIKQHEAVLAALAGCEAQIKREDRLLKARAMKFKLELGFNGVAPRFQSYFKQALGPSALQRALRPLTDAPARVDVQYDSGNDGTQVSGAVFVTLRFDLRRYWTMVRKQAPTTEERAIDLDPILPVIKAAMQFRDLAARFAPAGDRDQLTEFPVVIHLERGDGEFIAFEAQPDPNRKGQPQPPLHFKYEFGDSRPLVRLPTAQPKATLKTHLFFLDVPELVDGSPTEHALLFRFFGLAY